MGGYNLSVFGRFLVIFGSFLAIFGLTGGDPYFAVSDTGNAIFGLFFFRDTPVRGRFFPYGELPIKSRTYARGNIVTCRIHLFSDIYVRSLEIAISGKSQNGPFRGGPIPPILGIIKININL